MNKRGQEGVTLTTLLLIILGVVVVVVIILGATGVLNDVFGTRTALPGNLEAVSQSCKIAVQGNLLVDYCYNYKKISDLEYINCQDFRIKESLIAQGYESNIKGIECDGTQQNIVRTSVCDGLSGIAATKKDKVKVGNVACDKIGTTTTTTTTTQEQAVGEGDDTLQAGIGVDLEERNPDYYEDSYNALFGGELA